MGIRLCSLAECRLADFHVQEVSRARDARRQAEHDVINNGLIQLVILSCGEAVAQFIYTVLFRIAGARLVRHIRERVFSSLLRKNALFHQNNVPSELVSKMAEIEVIEHLVLEICELLRNSLFVFGGSCALMVVLALFVSLSGVGFIFYLKVNAVGVHCPHCILSALCPRPDCAGSCRAVRCGLPAVQHGISRVDTGHH